MENLESLEKRLGYKFTKTVYIQRALTHSSAHHDSTGLDYERLEFLGDRVVNLIVADLLFKEFRQEKEGALAKRHTALVRTETLALLARKLKLDDFVILSDSERRAGGADNDNILADVMESVTAAIYLDGGYNVVETFVKNILGDQLYSMSEPPRDPKTELQEWSQAENLGLPVYEVVAQEGPDHSPQFTVQVTVLNHPPQQATAPSKKRAEKEAARLMLSKVIKS